MGRRGSRMMLLAACNNRNNDYRRYSNDQYDETKHNPNESRYNNESNNDSYNRSYNRDNDSYNRDNSNNYDENNRKWRYYPSNITNYYYDGGQRNDSYSEENRRRRDSRGRYMQHPDPMNHIGFKGNEEQYEQREMRYQENEKLDRRKAERIVRKFENTDGSHGAHWSYDMVKQLYEQHQFDMFSPEEFYVAVNMMYADYCDVAKMMGINTVDFYVEMAKAFLCDPDAKENKLMNYIQNVT